MFPPIDFDSAAQHEAVLINKRLITGPALTLARGLYFVTLLLLYLVGALVFSPSLLPQGDYARE